MTAHTPGRKEFDVIIVGGGFFGCCLALYLRSVTSRIAIVESCTDLLQRASRTNQARVHTGFHYPRSFPTAMRSRLLRERFMRDFKHAVVDDFDMLYAIASNRSKVSAHRFARMFEAIDAPFERASARHRAMFDPGRIEDVYLCREFAFDWSQLRSELAQRLEAHGIPVLFGETARSVASDTNGVAVQLASGRVMTADWCFNVGYANLNALAFQSGLKPLALKHELTEVALVQPPAELQGLGVTVMDGPFFSTMPYPSESLYSLTHVRYTPHYSWTNTPDGRSPYSVQDSAPKVSRWRYMVHDAARYLPAIRGVTYKSSLFEVKTVLIKSERDDRRPILLHRHAEAPRVYSVLGAKIDNIYDLFEALSGTHPIWEAADSRCLID